MQLKAVVFDFDGTLINSSGKILEAFKYALAPFGVDVTDETIELIRTRSSHDLFIDLIDKSLWEKAWDRLEKISREHSENIVFFDGMYELLVKLKKKGLLLAVWTGRDTASAEYILKKQNAYKLFDVVVGNTCVVKNKPHPEGLLKVIEELEVGPTEVCMIGDHPHDLEGAKSIGSKKVLITHEGESFSSDITPDAYVRSALELEAYLLTNIHSSL